VKGDILFSDLVESSDTVRFGSDNFVTLVFVREDVLNLTSSDFSPVKSLADLYGSIKGESGSGLPDILSWPPDGTKGQQIAALDPDTLDLGIDDVLNHISGEILVSDPSITLNYSNSFVNPIEFNFYAVGKRRTNTVDLNLAPFILTHPSDSLQGAVSGSYLIDKNNSSLAEVISMLPEKIYFSGSAVMTVPSKGLDATPRSLTGSVEVKVPLRFRANNLQYGDTTDNFLADAFDEGSDLNWNDFELFRIDFDVKNGFPFGASLEMSLRDSVTREVISTITAGQLLAPAPVNSDGKAIDFTESKASVTFTEEFFSSIERSDKIIFLFTMNTTDNGSKDVKIYSDYRLDFKASLILKPDIKFDLK
jgi:hypothetical protein